MKYPVRLQFKLLTLGQRISATDAAGQPLLYVKQKMFKLKEKVEVYADESQTRLLFHIQADRVIDFSANYSFTDADGQSWGAVRRSGMRSLWSAHYEILRDNQVAMVIREESPFKKLVESLLGGIPILGLIAVYLLNPTYIIARPDGEHVLRLSKLPAIFEGKFELEKLGVISEDDELRALLAVLMVGLLERKRG